MDRFVYSGIAINRCFSKLEMAERFLEATKGSLVPRRSVLGRRAPGIHCLRTCGSPGFCGDLETTVILVHVARPYITETRESFTSTRRSSVEPSRALRPSIRSESQERC